VLYFLETERQTLKRTPHDPDGEGVWKREENGIDITVTNLLLS
jgi:hypothetical protein